MGSGCRLIRSLSDLNQISLRVFRPRTLAASSSGSRSGMARPFADLTARFILPSHFRKGTTVFDLMDEAFFVDTPGFFKMTESRYQGAFRNPAVHNFGNQPPPSTDISHLLMPAFKHVMGVVGFGIQLKSFFCGGLFFRQLRANHLFTSIRKRIGKKRWRK